MAANPASAEFQGAPGQSHHLKRRLAAPVRQDIRLHRSENESRATHDVH